MKKSLTALAMAAVLALGSYVAMAEPANVLKFDDQTWYGFDAADGVVFNYVDYIKVETNSKTDRVKYSVHGHLAEGAFLPNRALKLETGHLNFICSFSAPYFKYVLRPDGSTLMQCRNWPFAGQEDF